MSFEFCLFVELFLNFGYPAVHACRNPVPARNTHPVRHRYFCRQPGWQSPPVDSRFGIRTGRTGLPRRSEETGIRASEANPETGRPRGGHWAWDRHREDDLRGAGLCCAFQPDGSGDWTQADRLGRSQHALGGELLGRVANRSSGMTSGCKQITQEGCSMDYINNRGEKIGSLDIAISNDKSVTINRLNDVTTVTVRDRNTGKVTSETFFGDSPFGK